MLFFADEMRYGLMSNLRRSWSLVGERAVLPQQQAFVNRYLYSAVSPLSGESFHLVGLDEMDTDVTYTFLLELKKQFSTQEVILVWDNAPCHRPKKLQTIPGLTLVALPSYSPELNPTERFFEEIRRATANSIFEQIETQETVISNAVKHWSENLSAMKQLLGYPWIQEQCYMVN